MDPATQLDGGWAHRHLALFASIQIDSNVEQ